ncbi:MAG TPA: hypothetical protein VG498_16440 [Terriglobales bacterium]|nr:hypothetical protein [Terriglobales bacterium]
MEPGTSAQHTAGVDVKIGIRSNLVANLIGLSGGQNDAGGSLNYRTDFLGFVAQRRIDQNFNPEVGFIERNNCMCDFSDLTLKPRPKLKGIRELQFEGFIFHAPDLSSVLQTQEWQTTFHANFHNGAYTDDDIFDVLAQRIAPPFNIYKNV